MRTLLRHYDHKRDYERVSRFLVRTYRTSGEHANWLQPRWEYMHYHPAIRGLDLACIGIWEADGDIVAVVHPEHSLGSAYIEIDPAYATLKGDMLAYAEQHLAAESPEGRFLRVLIDDRDLAFQDAAKARGYEKSEGFEAMSRMAVADPFPTVPPPEGFSVRSLAEDNDVAAISRLLWRGFDHPSEPPHGSPEGRRFMESAPNFDKDLNVAAKAPDGTFVSYCGMWYEPVHRVAYVEPVCTDPDYRRRGLARAAVLEGIRRCAQRGATVAYVGAVKPLYLALGFRQVYNRSVWRRQWS